MAGQVCREIKDINGKIIGFEVVEPVKTDEVKPKKKGK